MAYRSRYVERPGSTTLLNSSGGSRASPDRESLAMTADATTNATERQPYRSSTPALKNITASRSMLTDSRPRSRASALSVTHARGVIGPILGSPMLLVAAPAPDEGEPTLARPLTGGLRVAASIASFQELALHGVWTSSHDETSFLSQGAVDALFDARCEDQKCPSSADRRCRFYALMTECCRGGWFVLRQADLGPKSVAAIATMLAENSHITHLDLSGNHIGPEGALHLAKLLQENETICVLRLQSANLAGGCLTLASALRRNNTVTALDLSGICGIHRNTIWGGAVIALSEMLAENQVLAYLNLGACGLQRGAADVCIGALNNCSLTYLGLASNHIGDYTTCGALFTLLTKGRCKLESLDLAHNGISSRGLSRLAAAMRSGGDPVASLTILSLADNAIDGLALEEFAQSCVASSAKLHTLNLSGNPLNSWGVDSDGFRLPASPKGLGDIFAGFKGGAPFLTKLMLNSCDLDSLPAELPVHVEGVASLTWLELAENRFGDAGLALIGEMLKRNASIKTLRAHRCRGTATGVTALCNGIKVHPSLESVTLFQGGPLDDALVVEAILCSSTLLSIDLPKDPLALVAPSLAANKLHKMKQAAPALAETRRQASLQQRSIDQAKELITGEIKSRDKLTEASRQRRERQKVQMAAFKEELVELEASRDRGLHEVQRREVEYAAVEEEQNEQRKIKEGNLLRCKTRLERQIHLKQTAMTACIRLLDEHFRQYPSSTVALPAFARSICTMNANGAIERSAAAAQPALGSVKAPGAASVVDPPSVDPVEAELQRRLHYAEQEVIEAERDCVMAQKRAEELEVLVTNPKLLSVPRAASSRPQSSSSKKVTDSGDAPPPKNKSAKGEAKAKRVKAK